MVLIAAMTLTFFRIWPDKIIKLVLLTTITLIGVYVFMKLVSPATLDYNLAIIDRFLYATGANIPRKLIIFQNYLNAYTSDFIDLLFGSGPGTFNSRSAFMVGSPTYFNIDMIKSGDQPFYFREYAYSLWNPSNTGPYDGFMNQPFSSFLAILGEYGLLFTATLVYLLIRRFKFYYKMGNQMAKTTNVSIEFQMYRFCSIFALLLVIIDNYMEYPEILALLLIIVNLGQQELRKAFDV